MPTNTVYPNVHDGAEGMHFIEQCVASSAQNAAWLPMKHPLARNGGRQNGNATAEPENGKTEAGE